MNLDQNLLEILVCPLSKAPLLLEENRLISTDERTRLSYRIEDDILVLLVDEAEELDLDVWREIMRRHDKA